MSPALPREERDAIRALAIEAERGAKCGATYDGHTVDGVTVEMLAAWTIALAQKAFALLGALDAAEEENGRLRPLARRGERCFEQCHETRLGLVPPPFVTDPQTMDEARQKIGGLRGALASGLAERDAARAEVAALRGRIEALAADVAKWHDREHDRVFTNRAGPEVRDALRRVHDTLRALAADEGERTGR